MDRPVTVVREVIVPPRPTLETHEVTWTARPAVRGPDGGPEKLLAFTFALPTDRPYGFVYVLDSTGVVHPPRRCDTRAGILKDIVPLDDPEAVVFVALADAPAAAGRAIAVRACESNGFVS